MKSLYKRQFMLMAGVILISFALLGGAFVTLSYQYAVQEKRDSLGDNAKYIAQSFMRSLSTASTTLGQQNDYAVNIDTLAKVSDSYVIVTETDGLIFYSSDGSDGSNLAGGVVPSYMVSQVAATGSYSGMTDLGGIFPEKRFVAGTPILVQTIDFKTGQGLVVQDKLFGMVFVAAETASLTEMWRAFASIFFFTSIVVLLIAFITSSVTSLRQTKPLKEMAEAARKFGHGEFDVRVSGSCERCDEVGELATAFNAMADSLAKSEARRSEFVANISHELKTPLASIRLLTDSILQTGDMDPATVKDFVSDIGEEAERLTRISEKLLTLTRMDSAVAVAEVPVDVKRVVEKVEHMLTPLADEGEVTVETDLQEDCMVLATEDDLYQIAFNLMENAVKYNLPGGSVTVTLRGAGDLVTLTVEDTGVGIPEEDLGKVFDRFYRVDKARSRAAGGTGLGLSIVRDTVRQHGGAVTVRRRESEGTCFEVAFPRWYGEEKGGAL